GCRLHVMCSLFNLFFLFFFSSRRRHTRFSRDWSSDVCSSDLTSKLSSYSFVHLIYIHSSTSRYQDSIFETNQSQIFIESERRVRSEERRVGKECRSRWAAD